MWTHLEDKKQKARKLHRCCLCGLEIAIGVEYIRRTGSDGGDMHRMKMHVECEAVTRDWDDSDWENTEPERFLAELESE